MDLNYSPILDEAGEPAGVLAIVTETSERVRGERRQAFLYTVGERLREQARSIDISALTTTMLGEHLGADRAHWSDIDDAGDQLTIAAAWAVAASPR